MEDIEPTPLPRALEPTDEDVEMALSQIDAAIALVVRGVAVRIRLIGFALADVVAGLAAAHAQLAGVAFRVDRLEPASAAAMIVGPRI